MHWVWDREAIVPGVNKNRGAVIQNADIMRIQRSGEMDCSRDETCIEYAVRTLTAFQAVLKLLYAARCREHKSTAFFGRNTHRLAHIRLMNVDAAVRILPNEVEDARLI